MEIIARRAEGGMRDALSILDQALSLTQGNERRLLSLKKLLAQLVYQPWIIMCLPYLNRMFPRLCLA